MNKLVVYRTRVQINDYTMGDCHTIERLFSIYDALYHKAFPKGMIYNKERRELYLPRGIDISYIESILGTNAVIDRSVDESSEVGPIMLKCLPRDDVQKTALRFMLGTGEYTHNKNRSMLSVNLNTGKGKTYCAVAAMSFIAARSIIITNAKGWLEQWKTFILEYTDIKESEIYFVSGAPSIQKLYKRDPSKYKVLLVTHATLKSYGDTNGWDSITEFFRYMKIGVKIYDEAHLNFDNMCSVDFYTNSMITYYITASPGRSDRNENNIFGYYFKNVPGIDLFDINEDPHTAYVGIKYNSHPLPRDASDCKNAYGLDRNKYTNYVVEQENFERMLHVLIGMVKRKPGKHLFYVGTNEAILKIRNWIYYYYPEFIGDVGIYTSLTTTDKKAELEKKLILSTTKSAGAAMDIHGLVETVNLAEPFKSKILAQQTFGRTRGKDTLYKDIVDTGFFYTKSYYDFKKSTFMKYATKCSEIVLSDQELKERAEKEIARHDSLVQPIIYTPEDNYEHPRHKRLINPIEYWDNENP